MNSGKLILVRHGLSVYNDQNRFTGWKDVDLNEQGISEAKEAVSLLEEIDFDMAFTSELKRANNTLDLILKGIKQESITIEKDVALNERDYGDLVGQNKAEAAEKFGDEQVQIWRRSYDIPPPGGESLKDTADRVIPYLNDKILPMVYDGKNIIVSAHGNSIRAIVMALKNFTPKEILKTEIGWCEPWIFEFENKKLVNLEIKSRPNSKSMSKLPN
ncbi:MAG: 2,3-bisphosphoglycerate-dependent phosphoglycerate mutase [Marine Group III euryarchaeote CG-Epi3]|uniref:2,3-bisphosphoglycerate-dependent phosphoglycerate mutase n=1 Tax=Marine Group III euryarchaeote CG-Epi3 TaxID=1888997 RepID=A0A1J5TRH9_9ARCH|nr:MAG: 2,3-bisphosphoglycerate-dependent phosphoglycerate mutase [Marine Group III euryarchaeote CG-Epi3]|tara:strand:+ start:2934 stop:3581 length:648 start_codon:yes stop_codon:yes gene_type:complete